MSKVSPFSPFRLEDFPSERTWLDKLFLPLNTVLTEVTQALNGALTPVDNIPTFSKLLTGSNLSLPFTFKFEGRFTPTQMVVAQAVKAGAAITMLGAWSQSGDTLTVSELFEVSAAGNTPLTTGPKYSILLRFT